MDAPSSTKRSAPSAYKGVAEIVDASASAPALSIAMTGSVQIADRMLALKGTAMQATDDAKPAAESAQLPFDVIGSWDDPVIVPDAQKSHPPLRSRRAAVPREWDAGGNRAREAGRVILLGPAARQSGDRQEHNPDDRQHQRRNRVDFRRHAEPHLAVDPHRQGRRARARR